MHDIEAWMESNNNGAGRNACAIEVDGSIIRYTYFEELFWKRYNIKTIEIGR